MTRVGRSLWRWVVAGVLGVALAAPALADFKVYTQNTLHLGYGSKSVGGNYKKNKRDFFRNVLIANADVVLFQEVMKQADPFKLNLGANYSFRPNVLKPVAGAAVVWPNRKGFGKYKEAYLLAGNTGAGGVEITCWLSFENKVFLGAIDLARPPDVYLVRSRAAAAAGTGVETWLVNFHAIWGSNKKQRMDEAQTLHNFVVNRLQKSSPSMLASTIADMKKKEGCATNNVVDRVVLAGDWNLTTADLAGIFHTNFKVEPAGLTSLSDIGEPVNSYDHFIWSKSVTAKTIKILDPDNHTAFLPPLYAGP